MSKTPAAAEAALLLLALWASPAAAQDAGTGVAFPARAALAFSPLPAPGQEVFATGESEEIPESWDTVLLQGVSPDAGIEFEASRKLPSGGWTAWVPASAARYPGGRFWARAELAAGRGPLRLRAVDHGLTASGETRIYGVEVFERAAAAAAAVVAASTQPAASPVVAAWPRPPVHGRQEWGARAPKEAYAPLVAKRMTLHHTSGPQTKTLADSLLEARFIQEFHQRGRGWSDIAYHFLIDAAGNIIEGRPEDVVGAHTKNNNDGNIGIVLLGTYQAPKNDKTTAAEMEALIALGRYLASRHGIDPATLRGHRDYNPTDCPGDNVYPLLGDLRAKFAAPPPSPSSLPTPGPALSRTFPRAVPPSAWDGRRP